MDILSSLIHCHVIVQFTEENGLHILSPNFLVTWSPSSYGLLLLFHGHGIMNHIRRGWLKHKIHGHSYMGGLAFVKAYILASAHMAYATMASQTGTRATSRWRCQGFSESSRLRRRSNRMGDSKSPFSSFSLPSIWKAKAQIVVPCFVWHLYKAFFLRLHPDNLKHQGVADLLWLINSVLGFSTDASAVIFSMTPLYLVPSNWWFLSRFLIDLLWFPTDAASVILCNRLRGEALG